MPRPGYQGAARLEMFMELALAGAPAREAFADFGDARGLHAEDGQGRSAAAATPAGMKRTAAAANGERLANGDAGKHASECGKMADLEALAPVKCTVFTPYGIGTVEKIRADSAAPFQVALDWGAHAFLRKADIKRKKKLFEMSDEERVEAAHEHKHKGKLKFEGEMYNDALCEYELAILYARQVKDPEVHRTLDVDSEIVIPCYQNTAFCQIKLGAYSEAVEAASEALKLRADSVKALFFRGRANRLRSRYDLAKADLAAALKMQPNSSELRKELKSLQDELANGQAKERAMFKGILASGSPAAESHKRPHAVDDLPSLAQRKKSRTGVEEEKTLAVASSETDKAVAATAPNTKSAAAAPAELSVLERPTVLAALAGIAILAGVALVLARRK